MPISSYQRLYTCLQFSVREITHTQFRDCLVIIVIFSIFFFISVPEQVQALMIFTERLQIVRRCALISSDSLFAVTCRYSRSLELLQSDTERHLLLTQQSAVQGGFLMRVQTRRAALISAVVSFLRVLVEPAPLDELPLPDSDFFVNFLWEKLRRSHIICIARRNGCLQLQASSHPTFCQSSYIRIIISSKRMGV